MNSRIVVLGVIAGLGVVLSVIMVAVGLPEQTATQQIMLELGSLPLSVALAAGNLILLERAVRHPGPRGRRVLGIGAGISVLGLAVLAVSFLSGFPAGVQFGQFLIFVGLGAVLLIAIRLQPSARRQAVSFSDGGPLTPQSPTSTEAAADDPGTPL